MFTPPPSAELEIFQGLIELGSMRRIREWADQFKQLDQKYIPFANKVRQLAEAFEEQQILALVQEYLSTTE